MAAAAPDIDLAGLTVVGGNVGLAHTLRNARVLVDLIDRPVPVYPGAQRPLLASTGDAAHVHGSDGFGDAQLPDPQAPLSTTAAAVAMLELSHSHAGELELIALGPLTNLALALRLDPQLPQRIKRLVVMGGAIDGPGNTTPYAEFNIGFDPEAAEVVFREWPELELVDWSATLRYAPAVAAVETLLAADTPKARLMQRISRRTAAFVAAKGAQTWAFADPLAMLALLHPAASSGRHGALAVELAGERRGQTTLSEASKDRARVRAHESFADGALLHGLELALV